MRLLTLQNELLIKPVTEDSPTFLQRRLVNPYDDGGMTMSGFMDVNGIFTPPKAVQCLDHVELVWCEG
jgi:hypothetical protein